MFIKDDEKGVLGQRSPSSQTVSQQTPRQCDSQIRFIGKEKLDSKLEKKRKEKKSKNPRHKE